MPTIIDLSSLGSAGFIIQGDAAGDRAGYSVSSAGDLNNDGFDDLIVGAPLGDDGGNQAGEAYVIFGKASSFGTIDLTNLGSAGFVIQGDADIDYAGWSVSSAGDVNGDGFDDLIVGAYRGDDGGSFNAGKAYVIFGKASGFGTIDLASLGGAGFVIQGDANYDTAGFSVASAGDVNGDGFDDMIVGAPRGDDGGFNAGEAYVIFGKSGGFGTIDLTNLGDAGFIIQGDADLDYAGCSVSSAGDINGDGFDDVIVGARYGDEGDSTNAGQAYVIFGKASGFGTIDLTTLGSAGFTIQGDMDFDRVGTSVSSAGDINGDGFDDLIVGAPYASHGSGGDGQAYVVFGKASGFGTIDLASLGDAGFIIRGDLSSDNAGRSVSSAGDVNGDGFDDLIVGAPFGSDGGSFAGGAYVIFGKASGFGTIDLTALDPDAGFFMQGDASGDRAGTSVAGAGDVNDDGFDDLIVGAPYGNDGGPSAGEAYVIFGMTSVDQQIFGTPGDDVLKGGFGNDFIDGGDGDDEIFGQLGNDELAGGGGNDTLDGGQGNDFLDGGAGVDTMAGGFHNDVYVVDNGADRVTEGGGGGTDRVSTLVDYQLAAGSHVERLTSISWALTTPLKLTGNEFVNLIEGNAGNNTLDGRGGADRLVGFGGDDKYVVDKAGDVVVEGSGGGTDSVSALVDYTLAAGVHVERLNAISAALTTPLKLTGNEVVNLIEGNAGNNILDGRGGADRLVGFGGNDKYVVDNAGDVVVELAGGGTDSVSALVDYTLAPGVHVERLNAISFALTTPLKLTGNELVNLIEGNAGNNTLDGRGGADTMIGFGGDDAYVVDHANDLVVENAGQGLDTAYAVVDYRLREGTHVETLSAISWAATNPLGLTGNGFANTLYGNAGNNVLNGGGGADTLVGFGGADTFAFTSALGGGNIDAIEGFLSGTDKVALDDAIFTAIGAALDAAEFRVGAGAADANDRIIYNSATGQLFYDSDGVGGAAQVQFATLTGAPLIAASDFLMI